MSKRIEIADATPEELRRFGATVLGLELTGRETKQMMLGKLAEVGYGADFIMLPETQIAPSGNDRTPGRPFSTRPNPKYGPDGYDVLITIHTQDKPGGEEPVPVSVNGSNMWIPRGKPVWVPSPYVEVLEHAIEYVYPEYDPESNDGLGGLGEPRRVLSYPFSYA